MTLPINLIIDCDPGVDDALALWLAAARPDRLRLLAVTTVAGNRPVDTTCDNAIRLLDAAGLSQVPVYRGAARPIDGADARCNLVHGADGLGGVVLPLERSPQPVDAWNYLVQALNEHPPHSLTLATLGPLTNLALAEQHQPGVLSRFKQVVVMGGAVTVGNVWRFTCGRQRVSAYEAAPYRSLRSDRSWPAPPGRERQLPGRGPRKQDAGPSGSFGETLRTAEGRKHRFAASGSGRWPESAAAWLTPLRAVPPAKVRFRCTPDSRPQRWAKSGIGARRHSPVKPKRLQTV
jgi:hypothetical protein